jgi:hypothetical protein
MMKRYLLGLKGVLVLAALNSAVWIAATQVLPGTLTDILFIVFRMFLATLAGWVVFSKRLGGYWGTALGGALVLFVDHTLVHGGYFLISGEPGAFAGVLISFAMFAWVAMLLGWLGGLAGRTFDVPDA